MLRYKLRTLMIVLAIGPMALAAGWWAWPKAPATQLELLWEDLGPPEVYISGGCGIRVTKTEHHPPPDDDQN